MIVTVASGKGGTGKTTVATSLALSLAGWSPGPPPFFLDCDVEAPNAHIFLKPTIEQRQEATISIPQIDEARCTFCARCAEVCQYHAIAVLGRKTLVFPQLCHGCGSCSALCPENAIKEVTHMIGVVERGIALAGIPFACGALNVGEPMAVPVIRQLLGWTQPVPGQVVIRDAPPGASCPLVAAMRGSDFLILVTEPTPFGLHDLRLATQVAMELHLPAAVIVNRYIHDYPELENYCRASAIPIVMRIPLDRQIAQGLAQGRSLIEIYPGYIERFREVFLACVNHAQAGNMPILLGEHLLAQGRER